MILHNGKLVLPSAHMYQKAMPAAKGLGGKALQILKGSGRFGALAAAPVLGSLALLSILSGKEKAGEKMTRGSDFKKVLREAPSLSTSDDEKAKALKHYMSLRRLAPDIAKDPMVSAGYVKKARTYENEGVDPSVILPLLLRQPSNAQRTWEGLSQNLPQAKLDPHKAINFGV